MLLLTNFHVPNFRNSNGFQNGSPVFLTAFRMGTKMGFRMGTQVGFKIGP